MPHSFQGKHELRMSNQNANHDSQRDVAIVDPIAEQKSEYRRYAAVSFIVSLMFSGLGIASIALSRPTTAQRFARDLNFNATALNGTQTIECPVDRDLINASIIVQACQMVADYCGNSSLLNDTFQFMLNLTCNNSDVSDHVVECLTEPSVNFTGRCMNTDAQSIDWPMNALFFLMSGVFLAGCVAYLVRATKVGAPAVDLEAGDPIGNRYRITGSINGDPEARLLSGAQTPIYGAAPVSPREKW